MIDWENKKTWGIVVITLVIIGIGVIGWVLWLTSSPEGTPTTESLREQERRAVACKPLAEVCKKSRPEDDYVLTCYYSTAADFLNYNNWRCYLGRSAYSHFLDGEGPDLTLQPLCGGKGEGTTRDEDNLPIPINLDNFYPYCYEVDWYADKTGLLNGYVPEDYIWNAGAGWFEDPTGGFVSYSSGCRNLNKIVVETDELVELRAFKVPELNLDAIADGAPSFKVAAPRLESRQIFNEGGLFLMDVDHIPAECGVWPAFWLLGGPDSWNSSYPNAKQEWPNYGEIDIIEQVNSDPKNHTTLHTPEGCTIGRVVSSGGKLGESDNCAFNDSYTGCSIKFPDYSSQNVGRNGVYACEWIPNEEINFWFFPKGSIPNEIKNSVDYGDSVSPARSAWESQTSFWSKIDLSEGCNQDFFKNMRIVINTTFCGDWAGRRDRGDCTFELPPDKGSPPEGCNNEIKKFIEKYKPYEPIPAYTWRIKSVRVYQKC